MQFRTPHYYKKFVCTASECKDNCCFGGWQIDIDEETVEYYKKVEGEFGEKLRAALNYTDTHCFKLVNGVCPFLDENNLCGIYKELGPEHMGVVCTQFPRFSEYYGKVKESGIGLACEEAARIIFLDKEDFSYDTQELEEEAYEDSEFDSELGEILFLLRNRFIKKLEQLSVKTALLQMVTEASDIQNLINENDYEAIRKYIEKPSFEVRDSDEDYLERLEEIWGSIDELYPLNEEWSDNCNEVFEALHGENIDYASISEKFNKQEFLECKYDIFVKYYLYRYLLKASYDHDLFSKIALAVTCLIVLREWDLYSFVQKGEFTFEDRMSNVHILSREIEYSEENIDILYDEFIFGDTYSRDSLIALISNLF